MSQRLLLYVLLTLLCAVSVTTAACAQPSSKTTAKSKRLALDQPLRVTYSRLPLVFIRNAGQTDKQVQFLTQSNNFNLFLTPTEAVFSLTKPTTQLHTTDSTKLLSPVTSVVRLRLNASNPHPAVYGIDALPGKANYFFGNEPTQWHTNVPTYARVRYAAVYPGIDLVYYGNQSQLEYDFVVAPHASPKRIAFSFAGAKQIRIERSGELSLILKDGLLRWHRPVVYQEVDGRRKPIAGRYILLGQNSVGFQIGRSVANLPIVIDPQLVYSTFLGGTSIDSGAGIALDGQGNAYVTGTTSSLDFPTTQGAFQTHEANAYGSVFVARLSADGSSLIYSTFLGGSGFKDSSGYTYGDKSSGIAVDAQGAVYITGTTHSSDFPVTKGAAQTTMKGTDGAATAFVTKLNPDGASLGYSTYLGGSTYDSASAIAVDSRGNAYVAGGTSSGDFPVTRGAFQPRPKNSSFTGFVTKLTPTGASLGYSTFLGGSNLSGGDYAAGIAVDAQGTTYITGTTHSADFPTTKGAFQTTLKGSYNAFVTQLNTSGSALLYSTFLGGTARDNGFGIAVDASGDAFVTGSASSTDFPVTRGAFQTHNRGNSINAFIARLNPAGSALLYSTYLGGTGRDRGYAITVDGPGNAYVTGLAFSADFPVTQGALQTVPKNKNGYSAFLTKLSANGSALLYSTYLGGANYLDTHGLDYGDTGAGIAVDALGNAYITGQTSSANFPVTKTAFQTKLKSNYGNAFVASVATAFPAFFSVVPHITGAAGEKATLAVQLNDSATRTGIPDASLTFTLNLGAVTADLGTATTDIRGKTALASTVPDGLTAGRAYPLQVSFYGNSEYTRTTGTGTLEIVKGKTAFTSVPNATGKLGTTVTLTTHLSRSSDGKALDAKTVIFNVGRSLVGTAQTDSTGLASVTYTIPKNIKIGDYATSATFNGDANYTGCILKGLLNVTK